MKKFVLAICLTLFAASAFAEPIMIPRGGRGNGVTITFGDSGRAMTAPVVPSVVVTPFAVVVL